MFARVGAGARVDVCLQFYSLHDFLMSHTSDLARWKPIDLRYVYFILFLLYFQLLTVEATREGLLHTLL